MLQHCPAEPASAPGFPHSEHRYPSGPFARHPGKSNGGDLIAVPDHRPERWIEAVALPLVFPIFKIRSRHELEMLGERLLCGLVDRSFIDTRPAVANLYARRPDRGGRRRIEIEPHPPEMTDRLIPFVSEQIRCPWVRASREAADR